MWSFSWFGQKVNKFEVKGYLASLNCSERSEFEDDSAVSLETSGSKSLHYTFYSRKPRDRSSH